MELNELLFQIDNIKEIINIIDNTVKFHIQVMWGAIAFVVAAAGASLYFLAKHWFTSTLEIRLKQLEQEIKKSIAKEYKSAYGMGIVGINITSLNPSDSFDYQIYIGFKPSRVRYLLNSINSSATGLLKKDLNINYNVKSSAYGYKALLEQSLIIDKAKIENNSFILTFKNISNNKIDVEKMHIIINWEAEYLFWEDHGN